MKKRKLFCEISPFTYWLSTEKEILKRHLHDTLSHVHFAAKREDESLPVIVYRHTSLIRRRLGNVDMRLQENKATNLALAVKRIDGVMIRPGETFSVWKMIGRTTSRKGFMEGLTITKGEPAKGIGGGLCQLSNLIHWMVLHSELTIAEHHHHDGLDLFPDFGRQIPFGTGTSISYNYIDYRVRNDTNNTYQLRLWVDAKYLHGELRALKPQQHTFHIHAENEFFSREDGIIYRNGEVWRDVIDCETGNRVDSQLIRTNHARVMYECPPSVVIHEKTNYEIISERQEKVLHYLTEHNIPFTTYNHPEGKSIEEAKRWWRSDGSMHCKNIFMRNHKGDQHYLICFPCDDDLAIHDIEHWLKDVLVSKGMKAPGKLSFASPERMMRYLGLEPGSVSPFGLINDIEHHVILFLDSRLQKAESLSFHPNDCRGTVVISQNAFQQYLSSIGNKVEYIDTQGGNE